MSTKHLDEARKKRFQLQRISGHQEKVYILVVAIIYMLCIVSIKTTARTTFHIMGKTINGSTICGAITEIPVMLAILLTIKCRRYGYIVANILCLLFTFIMASAFVLRKEMGALPGVVMVACGFVICTILRSYLKSIDENESKLRIYAEKDDLTGLPNRRILIKKLKELIGCQIKFALVFIDLDNFKLINDTKGHDDGDVVLYEIAQRWGSVLNDNEFIARFGGDEFALIIKNYTSHEELINRVEEFAEAIKEKIEILGCNRIVTASYGIALYPEHSKNANTLLKYADMAMYSSKDNGKSGVTMFNESMASKLESDTDIESSIRWALENNGFFVMYQPQFHSDGTTLRGFEVLARMRDINGDIISPGRFIPVAEKCDLISEIERIIIRQALSAFSVQTARYKKNFLLAVNVSPAHLRESSFISDINAILDETGFPPECLEVEITESLLISAIDQSIAKLNILKKMGIKIALDDFGTGYASLNYLHILPIDLLKVDKCFVDNIAYTDDEARFVDAIITLGHTLHYSVISEGVEKEDQLEILRKFNCDYIQGFLWGVPMETGEATGLLNEKIAV